MRFVGKWIGKARGMARHFRSGIDTMMREAELEELEKKWRQQNEEIMRAYPRVDEPAPASPDAAPDGGGTEDLMRPTAASPDAPAAPPPGSALP